MPELLLAALVVAVFGLVKFQQVQFYIRLIKRTFSTFQPRYFHGDPYRYNPEVERDRERTRADAAELENERLRSEVTELKLERDLAKQQNAVVAARGHMKRGGIFALGALTCFASVNVAPQVARDMLEHVSQPMPARYEHARPTHSDEFMRALMTMASDYRLHEECGRIMCCNRPRQARLISWEPLVFRRDFIVPVPAPVEFFWRIPMTDDLFLATSGGEWPRPERQEPTSIMVMHAEPCPDEGQCAIDFVLTATLD